MSEPAEEPARDRRASRRSNLLLVAEIEYDGLIAQVRIRNVSDTGAMVEGPQVPKAGTRLWLKRGTLKVRASVAWADRGKAGLHFDEQLPVEIWAGGKPKPAEPAGLKDQRQIDALQAAIRAGHSTTAFDTPPSASPEAGQLNARTADEIKYVVRLIESLGDQLAGDPVILHKHATSLQNIDLANQILSHLANLITAEDPAAKVAEIGMTDLRARLTCKSLS